MWPRYGLAEFYCILIKYFFVDFQILYILFSLFYYYFIEFP